MEEKDIELKYNLDDKLKELEQKNEIFFNYYDIPKSPDSIIPQIDKSKKESYTIDEIHSISPPFQSGQVNNCIVFWDDVCQFTTLGAMDLFDELITNNYNKEKQIVDEANKHFDFYYNEFFNRKNELIDGTRFMYIAYEEVYTLEQIRRFYKKFYTFILAKSPMSSIIPILGDAIHLLKHIVIIFKHKIPEEIKQKLIDDLFYYWDVKRINKQISIYSLEEITEKELYQKIRPDAIFTPSGGETLTNLLNLKINNVDIFTNIYHNGFTPYFIEQYVMKLKMSIGPGLNRIHFYEDALQVDDPDAFAELSRLADEYEQTKNK